MARNKYDVDEILEESFDFDQFKRLMAYLKPYRKRFFSVAVMMLTASAFTMLIPQFFLRIMDVCIPAKDMRGVAFYSGLTLLAALYSAISLRYKIKHTNIIGQQIIHDLRSDIFEHLQDLPFSYYDNRPHGKIQVRVVNYVNSLSDLLSNGIVNTITDLCNLFFIVTFMFLTNVRLTLLCLCGLPILAAVVIFIKKRQHRAWQIQSNKQSNLNAYIAESINGIRVTQSFVREEMNSNIFNDLSSSYRKSWMHAVLYNFTMGPSVDLISMATTSAIYVLGIHWMFDSASPITIGVLIAFTSYVSRFWAPINTLAAFYNSLLTAISYLERIFETIDEPVSVKDAPGATEMPPIHGDVSFENVTFSYEPAVKILDNVNFHAKEGETFAIVGPTGAGKTTLVNLLSRFYNLDGGRILIDGRDARERSQLWLHSQMGYVLQNPHLFSGTIRENIRYGNLNATDEEIQEAAKKVLADVVIQKLENGYDSDVGESGGRLSTGEKQLISFARAILAHPAIFVLDEATSSIDTKTEQLIQKATEELLKGHTSFVIAHRLSTIRKADFILVVKDGKIIERGTHQELLEGKGYYYHLYSKQFEEEESLKVFN